MKLFNFSDSTIIRINSIGPRIHNVMSDLPKTKSVSLQKSYNHPLDPLNGGEVVPVTK